MTNLRAVTAFSRFGLGARIGDLASMADPLDAVLAEIDDASTALAQNNELPDSATLYAMVRQGQTERRRQRQAGQQSSEMDAAEMDQALSPLQLMQTETRQKLRAARQARIGFAERLVAFWTNHFAVEAGANQLVRGLAGSFEREAIRPHIFGRFADMALAATQHPAMLIYLNNAVSFGPQSRLGERRARGLNENHARELMELHTLGVDGGYTQADVTAFANVLTGWSIGTQPRQGERYGRFTFRREAHEPGPQTVLGKIYDQDGVAQGKAVLADFVASPATAQHIATKFARHFVADMPDPALVDRLVDNFIQSGGDLKALATCLVTDQVAWSAPASKIRTPQEFIWSAVRALDLTLPPRQVLRLLADLGQPLWDPPSPEGFKDDVATWLAPDAMTNRLDAADLMAARAKGPDDPREFAEAILGDALSPATATAIERAESRAQGLALMLMSPEFQRR
ncbi:DUF1800 family protein [uncultured Devosia sp.]|uniref:DUF1800 domain-containing protein n=1 Tax=uncultured Devosia sp. TaxID=211434 RepID=UPI0035CC1F75